MGNLFASNEPWGGITVTAPARLHLGFLDLHGGLGRRFGSLGVTIDTFQTRVTLAQNASLRGTRGGDLASAGAQKRARAYFAQLTDDLGLSRHWDVLVEEAIPEHQGMGSGTQMSLAVGTALACLAGLPPDTRELAEMFDRGARSGVGIGAFDHGGFLMDSGRTEESGPPPLTAHLDFPQEWRIILVLDGDSHGLHGTPEVDAFRRLPVFPQEKSAHLCRVALMQVLPALVEQDLTSFAKGVGEIQRTVGDHFAPAQGGRFTSPAVAKALSWAGSLGLEGVGQSSWGPTGFILLPDEASAEQVREKARRRFSGQASLQFQTVAACNHGHQVVGTKPDVPRRAAH